MARQKGNTRRGLGSALALAVPVALAGCDNMRDYEGTFQGYKVEAHTEKNDAETVYRTLRISDRTVPSIHIYATDITRNDGFWDVVKFRGRIHGHPLESFTVSDLEDAWKSVVPSN